MVSLPQRVMVRRVPMSFAACLRQDRAAAIDVALARRQHAAYCAIFDELGIGLQRVDADEATPDCCFIEDTAVVWDGGGVRTTMAAPSRRAESAIHRDLPLLDAPLDGGDVMRAGDVYYVGLSSRTSEAGVEALRRASPIEIVGAAVADGLHLKSNITMLDETTAIAWGEAPAIAGVTVIAALEPWGANVLPLGDTVVVSAAAPKTAAMIRARGTRVKTVDISEFHKGDGALTCLSLRFPRAGTWCA